MPSEFRLEGAALPNSACAASDAFCWVFKVQLSIAFVLKSLFGRRLTSARTSCATFTGERFPSCYDSGDEVWRIWDVS